MTWLGLGAILVAAFTFTSQTAYPGSLVAIPVVGAGLVIAGGVAAPRYGVESLLRLPPCGWLGNLSYSLYLWHWPILIIAAESRGKTSLSFAQNVPFLALALLASVVSYALVENPIRHAAYPRRWVPLALGVGLIALTATVVSVVVPSVPAVNTTSLSKDKVTPGSDGEIARLVRSSDQITRLPADLTPTLLNAGSDFGWPPASCMTVLVPQRCVFGDPFGSHTMVLYGDSHALMWFQSLDEIAIHAHWRLIDLGHDYCMANKYPTGSTNTSNPILSFCSRWQSQAIRRIRQIDPDLVIVTQEYQPGFGEDPYTAQQWEKALKETLEEIAGPQTKLVVLGNIPIIDASPPDCPAEHPTQVQLCSGSPSSNQKYNVAEQRAVTAEGGRYITVTPWFCAERCSAVIGRYQVYTDKLHVTGTYSLFLQRALAQQLQLAKL